MKHEMTFKKLTERVALREGKKQEVNIAQIKEVTKLVLEELADYYFEAPFDFCKFLRRYF